VDLKLTTMKKINIFCLLAFIALSAFSFIEEPVPLVGRWDNVRNYQGQPWTLTADFKANGNFTGFINKKAFGSGNYKVKHDTLYIYEPTCDINYAGTYTIEFMGRDSLKFHVIQDTCKGRREGTNNFLFVRVKKTNP
jgi:hypothetical protein